MKRNDWLLAAVIIVIALLFMGYRVVAGDRDAGSVVVTVGGETVRTYSLTENQEIEINDTNRFRIENGEVKMDFATCPDKYCVNQNMISKNGESIICLPNKVVLEIQSLKASDLDAVAK